MACNIFLRFYYLFIYACVCMCVWGTWVKHLWRSEEGIKAPAAGVTSGCVPFHVGTESWTWYSVTSAAEPPHPDPCPVFTCYRVSLLLAFCVICLPLFNKDINFISLTTWSNGLTTCLHFVPIFCPPHCSVQSLSHLDGQHMCSQVAEDGDAAGLAPAHEHLTWGW